MIKMKQYEDKKIKKNDDNKELEKIEQNINAFIKKYDLALVYKIAKMSNFNSRIIQDFIQQYEERLNQPVKIQEHACRI